jgi:hypothetical protein
MPGGPATNLDRQPLLEKFLPIVFPVFFAAMWLAVGALLGVFSGWFRLAERYPDQREEVLGGHLWRSGVMGGVRMNGVLNLWVCPGGLRVGLMRVFGLFHRKFFVPWADITVMRRKRLFGIMTKLEFGHPPVASLEISGDLADKLARDAPGLWPETVRLPTVRPRPQSRLVE